MDFFTVPTIRFQVLYVFLVLAHDCRRILHFNVTWQRAHVERVIGSIRRECLDHVIVFHESSLRRTLKSYFERIFRWERTRRSHERFSRQKWGRLWRCRKSVGRTIAMNDALPEKAESIALRAGSPWTFENFEPSPSRAHIGECRNFVHQLRAEPQAD